MKKIISIFLLMFCCCGYCQDAHDMYHQASETVRQMLHDKMITRTQACERMLRAATTYFPNDDLLASTWVDVIELSKKQDRGEITQETYDKLNQMTWNNYNYAVNQQNQQYQQQLENMRSTAAAYTLMNGIGNAFRSASQPVVPNPVICNTRSGITTCY